MLRLSSIRRLALLLHGYLHLALPAGLHFSAELHEIVYLVDFLLPQILQVAIVFLNIGNHDLD